jgi:hypothetical protein
MNTWQPITPDSPIKEGDYIGGYDARSRWKTARVAPHMFNMGQLTIGRMTPTHWTEAVAFWGMPKRPKPEDCKVMELTF